MKMPRLAAVVGQETVSNSGFFDITFEHGFAVAVGPDPAAHRLVGGGLAGGDVLKDKAPWISGALGAFGVGVAGLRSPDRRTARRPSP